MNVAIRSLVLIGSISVIASCHKKDGPDPNPNSYSLTRIVEDARSTPGGNVSVIDFVYDGQQRIDKIVFSSGEFINGNLATTPQQTCKYYYNSSEKNPYKSTGKSPYWITSEADVNYYYNGSGQLIKDSLRSTSSSEIATRDYTYSTDNILVKKTTYDGNGSVVNTETDSFLIKDHNFSGNRWPGWIGTGSYGNNCTYDNKPNPFAQMNIGAVRMIEGIYGFPSYLAPGFCHNNITEATSGHFPIQGPSDIGGSNKFSYKYNAAGLPEECIVNTFTGTTYTVKYYYN